MPALHEITIDCPYCGEVFDTLIDDSLDEQKYYEDCYVCCQPILFAVTRDLTQETVVQVRRDDE